MSEAGVVALLDVRAEAFPTEEAAAEAWKRLETSADNYSLWRVTTPTGLLHALIICGSPEAIDGVDLGGAPYALTAAEAERFAIRRARLILGGLESGASHVRQREHYPDGALLNDDGTLS